MPKKSNIDELEKYTSHSKCVGKVTICFAFIFATTSASASMANIIFLSAFFLLNVVSCPRVDNKLQESLERKVWHREDTHKHC